ncbi:uncharacterized protein BO66DRAFT_401907 [Aspergillus aculeatinus CBS 121060]|uniref:Uncharacterized protein n=1 Tax=Aspergillus aculeatinus CBS 121060 TaxID=1448322 RepID=A0ACD1H8S4_9EURO|nr:hypothetical protein BO66DRAFT_401907 [Aspergillus aculeatinus CBS 121060]RAH69884.1 hypothetical protein BO66DRAFT_401907 [Aspergillus aculeatinus CBS 121060]
MPWGSAVAYTASMLFKRRNACSAGSWSNHSSNTGARSVGFQPQPPWQVLARNPYHHPVYVITGVPTASPTAPSPSPGKTMHAKIIWAYRFVRSIRRADLASPGRGVWADGVDVDEVAAKWSDSQGDSSEGDSSQSTSVAEEKPEEQDPRPGYGRKGLPGLRPSVGGKGPTGAWSQEALEETLRSGNPMYDYLELVQAAVAGAKKQRNEQGLELDDEETESGESGHFRDRRQVASLISLHRWSRIAAFRPSKTKPATAIAATTFVLPDRVKPLGRMMKPCASALLSACSALGSRRFRRHRGLNSPVYSKYWTTGPVFLFLRGFQGERLAPEPWPRSPVPRLRGGCEGGSGGEDGTQCSTPCPRVAQSVIGRCIQIQGLLHPFSWASTPTPESSISVCKSLRCATASVGVGKTCHIHHNHNRMSNSYKTEEGVRATLFDELHEKFHIVLRYKQLRLSKEYLNADFQTTDPSKASLRTGLVGRDPRHGAVLRRRLRGVQWILVPAPVLHNWVRMWDMFVDEENSDMELHIAYHTNFGTEHPLVSNEHRGQFQWADIEDYRRTEAEYFACVNPRPIEWKEWYDAAQTQPKRNSKTGDKIAIA